jgi:hypothetical protein
MGKLNKIIIKIQNSYTENLAEAFGQEFTAYRRETFKSMYRRSLLKPSAGLKQY